jgi:hypothetical protein
MTKRASVFAVIMLTSALAVVVAFAQAAYEVDGSAASVFVPAETATGAAACKPAVIGGKRTCIRVGQRCRRKFDRQYHRYGFHCHSGKVTRAAAPKPPPPPPPGPPRTPEPPGPGQRIDVGGYMLYIECSGSGSPAVVMEQGWTVPGATGNPGGFPPTTGWKEAQTALAADTRVCTYDRANLGASDDRPASGTPPASKLTEELRTLLINAGVSGPYVVVAASFGGLLGITHLIRYPSEFVGLVLVDAMEPCPLGCAFPGADRVAFDPAVATTPLGDAPLVSLTSGLETFLTTPLARGPDLARRSTNSMWVSTPGSGHGITETRTPVVIEATRLVVEAVRSGGRLRACEQTPLPSLGGVCEIVGR